MPALTAGACHLSVRRIAAPVPTEFAFFDWKYLKIVDDVLGKPNKTRAILMDNATAPAVFINADIEGVEVVVIPMRV